MYASIEGYDLLFPMDVDKKRIHAVIFNKQRAIQNITFPYDPSNLLHYVLRRFPGQRILFVYEAGPTGYGLYDYLKDHKQDCDVAVSSMIPKAPGQRVKTNRLDAYHLGIQLRTGELKIVNVPERKYRDLRHLVRLRVRYRKGIIATKCRLKSLYLFEGLQFPEGKWTRKVIAEIGKIDSSSGVDFKAKQLLKDLEFYKLQEKKTRAEIRDFCRLDEELSRCIEYLMSLPGVGWIISSYFLAALGGWKHLESTKSSGGFFGLGPSEDSTGDQVKRGRITAIGDPVARKMMIQASWKAIKKDVELQNIYDRVFYRHHERIRKQKAIVAVARHLVCRMHAVLRDQRIYEDRCKLIA
jgi:transposase